MYCGAIGDGGTKGSYCVVLCCVLWLPTGVSDVCVYYIRVLHLEYDLTHSDASQLCRLECEFLLYCQVLCTLILHKAFGFSGNTSLT